MFYYLAEKTETVDEKERLQKNKTKSWKYGYNAEIDTVIISKNGTLGQVFVLNGLNIGLPEKPEHKEIINWDKTAKNQIWQREEMPSKLTQATQSKHEDYINREYDRREQGVWIYINGKAVYLSRTYYFFIQWIREGNKYPNFRIIQNELMLYWEACKADERSFGICFVKPRRFGWSVLGYTELLESGTVEENKILGIISKKGTDAKKIFARMVRSFKRLPFFFMPELDGTTTPKSELVFAEQSRKRKIGEEVIAGQGLDTSISWHNTEINAMDGDEIFRSLLDEVGKFPKDVPFAEYWSIVQTSHTIGSEIVGKTMAGSTVNAMKKGGAEFKSVYEDSDPRERMESGETKSGLYKLMIPAKYCLAGFFDIYGFSVVDNPKEPYVNDLGKIKHEGSAQYLKNKLDALKGKPDKWNERLRQFPDTERDAFREEAGDCEFNLKKLIEQIDYNDYELNDKFDGEKNYYGNDIVERGNLMYKNGIQDSEVIWVPDYENGRWFWRKDCHPPEEYKNKKEMKMVNGHLSWTPMASHIGCIGADPYNRDKGADGRGSKGAITGSTKTNTSTMLNETIFCEYIDRARTVTQYFEDVIMTCVYTSMPLLGELSNEAFLTHVRDRGYRNFSMNNPFKKWSELSPTEKKLGGANPADNKIADAQMYVVEAHIENYVGIAEDESNRALGTNGDMVFTRTLIQWRDVDLKARTKYDAFISSSLSLLGNQGRSVKETPKPIPFKNPFAIYNNDGAISKRIS
jgi:hypothetical protein